MTRSPATMAVLLVVAGVLCAGFIALGIWQIERRSKKLALIARVEQRVHAAPVAAPGPERWAGVTEQSDGYRHVVASGRYRDDAVTFVQAVTARGPGFWAITPLLSDRGFTVLVNRGFVAARSASPGGVATVAGLVRLSEPKGGFLRDNDPAADRWYSRDVAAIARARHLTRVAPYFIDADAAGAPATSGSAAPNAPVGGLTVIHFANNHLVYVLTWFTLAAMVAGGAVLLLRSQRRRG